MKWLSGFPSLWMSSLLTCEQVFRVSGKKERKGDYFSVPAFFYCEEPAQRLQVYTRQTAALPLSLTWQLEPSKDLLHQKLLQIT